MLAHGNLPAPANILLPVTMLAEVTPAQGTTETAVTIIVVPVTMVADSVIRTTTRIRTGREHPTVTTRTRTTAVTPTRTRTISRRMGMTRLRLQLCSGALQSSASTTA